jgi:hypothetical protein
LHIYKEKQLRTQSFTAEAALNFGSEAWMLKKRDEVRVETSQIKL